MITKNEIKVRKKVFEETCSELLHSYRILNRKKYEGDKDVVREKIMRTICRVERKRRRRKRMVYISLSVAAAAACLVFGLFLGKNISSDNDYDNRLISFVSGNIPQDGAGDVKLFRGGKALKILDSQIEYDENGTLKGEAGDMPEDAVAGMEAESNEFDRLVVPRGKQINVSLSDGTRIAVNSGTCLAYSPVFDRNRRKIYVEGEVYLDVSKDEKRPFTVKTSRMDICVLGTSFNVSAYENGETSVTLVEGKVAVDAGDRGKSLLSPGEMLSLENGNMVKSAVDVYKYICWKDRVMLLERDPLESVLKKLSLYYGREVSCEKDIARISISGKLNLRKDLQDVIKIITTVSSASLDVHMQDGQIILKKARKREN
jgi:ferric-dicitrate binding protein FerR (iron transport regulator)